MYGSKCSFLFASLLGQSEYALGEPTGEDAVEMFYQEHMRSLVDEDDEYFCAADPDESDEIADHWTDQIKVEVLTFRKLVVMRMCDIFRAAPSVELHLSLSQLGIVGESEPARDVIGRIIQEMCKTSGTWAACAIEIHSTVDDCAAIADIFDTASHLFLPRHATSLREACASFDRRPEYRERAGRLLEKELVTIAQSIEMGFKPHFLNANKPASLQELEAILKLKQGTAARNARIKTWVSSALTTRDQPPRRDRLAAAAMFGAMGLDLNGRPPQHEEVAAAVAAAVRGNAERGLNPNPQRERQNREFRGRMHPLDADRGRYAEHMMAIAAMGGMDPLEDDEDEDDDPRAHMLNVIIDHEQEHGHQRHGGVHGQHDRAGVHEVAGNLDLDPDLADIRDDLTPDFEEQWGIWMVCAPEITEGIPALIRVYEYLVGSMPWLKGTDIANEMTAKCVPPFSSLSCWKDGLMNFFRLQFIKFDLKTRIRANYSYFLQQKIWRVYCENIYIYI